MREVIMFYKRGPSRESWSGFLRRSADGGDSWGREEPLPAGWASHVAGRTICLTHLSLRSHMSRCFVSSNLHPFRNDHPTLPCDEKPLWLSYAHTLIHTHTLSRAK